MWVTEKTAEGLGEPTERQMASTSVKACARARSQIRHTKRAAHACPSKPLRMDCCPCTPSTVIVKESYAGTDGGSRAKHANACMHVPEQAYHGPPEVPVAQRGALLVTVLEGEHHQHQVAADALQVALYRVLPACSCHSAPYQACIHASPFTSRPKIW